MFQSYLYGIEIASLPSSSSVFSCFNRTFMELKWNFSNCERIATLFQSYLYGIEISESEMDFVNNFVSIVPLWNWNDLSTNLHCKCILFQSYLYGIEIDLTPTSAWVSSVSIVPLWNWNKVMVVSLILPHYSFNRTFMELKFKNNRTMAKRVKVSIVPLWNWNKRDYLSILSAICVSIVPLWNSNVRTIKTGRRRSYGFNRTFMELKWGLLTYLRIVLQFQSYLYGIEMDMAHGVIGFRTGSFNRTFMELKFGHFGSLQDRQMFQSYLYGIEIESR